MDSGIERIKPMKKFSAIIMALTLLLSSVNMVYAETLNDVQGTKYESAVDMLVELEILNGYSDNTYRPENTVTRAEMATILVRTMDKTSYEELMAIPFNDMKGHWAEQFVTIAYGTKIIKGITENH